MVDEERTRKHVTIEKKAQRVHFEPRGERGQHAQDAETPQRTLRDESGRSEERAIFRIAAIPFRVRSGRRRSS